MSDCTITLLPTETCSHCSGVNYDPAWEETDYLTGERFDSLLPEAHIFSATKDGISRHIESDESISTVHRQPQTGRHGTRTWQASVRDVHDFDDEGEES